MDDLCEICDGIALENDQWLRVRSKIQEILDDKQLDDEYLGNFVRIWMELSP